MIADRALQALTVAALEPEWEARFESRSYGFRPGRSCQDAMQAVFVTTRGKTCKRVWALDADLAAAFDRIGHSCLLGLLGTFPARGRVEQWLKAGVLDRGRFAPTEQGCPQGGVISPVLMNVVLHGMEEAAGVRYHPGGHRDAGTAVPGSPVLIRYADDALALCHSRDQAEQVKARLAAWLEPRGLAFNEAKTAIVHLDDGVDFLGFNVRRYRGKRRLPAQVRLDEDHPAHAGQGLGVTRRPTLASYWAARRRRGTPPLDPSRLRLLKRQHGRCPLCGQLLLHADREPQHPDEWEQWIKAVRAATRHQAITLHARPGTQGGPAVPSLINTHCRRRLPDGTGGEPALPQR